MTMIPEVLMCRTCSRPRGENIADGTRCARCGHRQNMIAAVSLACASGAGAAAGGAPVRDAATIAGAVLLAFAPAVILTILLHELIHALAARSLGQTVTRVIVGEGRVLAKFGTRPQLIFGSVIVGNGMTWIADARSRGYRARWAFVLLSAPVISLLTGLVTWEASATWPVGARAAARTFAGANLFLAAISVIPVPAFGGRVWSDLASTMFLLRATQEELSEHRVQNVGQLVMHLFDVGQGDAALAAARGVFAATPRSPAAHSLLAYALHSTGRQAEARELAREASSLQMDESTRAYLDFFLEQPASAGAGHDPTSAAVRP